MRLVLLMALLLLGAAGCSTVRIAYNQADHIVAGIADDYFDLNADQQQAFRVHFERLHAWHRRNELPEYVALLGAAQQRIQAGPKIEDVGWLLEAVQARYRALVVQAHADAATLLATLSDEQVQAARRHFDKVNRKQAKEIGIGASPDEQRRLRARRHLERIEHWTGPLDTAQEAKVRELSRALPLVTEAGYRERLRRQDEFLALLQSRKSPGFAGRLREWLVDWERTRSSEYQTAYARFAQARAAMYVQVIALLSAEQRHHLVAVIERYQRNFRELSAQGAAQQATIAP